MYNREFFKQFRDEQVPPNFEAFKAEVINQQVNLRTVRFGTYIGKVMAVDVSDYGNFIMLKDNRGNYSKIFLSEAFGLEIIS